MKKKFIVLCLVLVLCVSALAGCGKKSGGNLVFATNPEFAPFEYVSSDPVIGDYDGIDMAIAAELGTKLGMEASMENLEFDSLLVALQNGQVDAVIAGMTITEERKESVDFTTPYYTATQVMIVPEGSDITCAADMEGKTIAVVQGYTGETCVDEMGYKYESFKKGTECILELTNGKCDVVVIDSATAQTYVNDNEGIMIVEDAEAFDSEEYGIAVKKGNADLLKKLNKAIEEMLDDGTIAEFITYYTELDAE